MGKLSERTETSNVTTGSWFHVSKKIGSIFTSFKISKENLKTELGISPPLDFTPEDVANKAITMTGNDASDTVYLSANAVYTWAISLFTQRITPITPDTRTKITYNALGQVLSGANATTSDINDSTDKRYLTDNLLSKLNETPLIHFGFVNATFLNESSKKIIVTNSNILITSKIILSIIPNGDIDEIEFYNINYSYGNFLLNTSFELIISLSEKTNKQFKINYQILN